MPVLRSVRSAIAKAVRRAIGVITDTLYSVAGEKPPLVADYVEEYYRGINVASFSDTISHTRSSNATMTDGYGPELVTNGDFSSTDISSLTASNATLSVAHGRLRVQNQTSAYGYAALTLTTEIGKAYILTVDILPGETDILLRVGTTFGGDQLFVKGYPNPDVQEEVCFIATTTTTYIRLGVNSNVNERYVEFDNVSVRAMPVIKWAPHNYCIYSEDPTQSNFNEVNLTISEAASVSAPDATMGVHKISFDGAAGDNVYITNGSTTIRGGVSGTFAVFAKAVSSATTIRMRIWDNGSTGAQYVDKSVSADSWTLLSHEATTSSNSTTSNFALYNNSSGDASDIYVWGFHIFRSALGGMVYNPDRGDSYVPNASRPVTGIELLANGSFPVNGDLTGWTTMSASAAVVNNQLVVTDDGLDATGGRAYYIVATEIGKRYEVSYDKISSVANGASIYASVNSSYGTNLGGGYTAAGGHSHYFTFVATTTTSHIIAVTGSSSGGTATFDNFSVKEVIGNPNAQEFAPRRNHHRFNGTEWVNEGLLHETSTTTNELIYSNSNFNAGSSYGTSIAYNQLISPTGALDGHTLTSDTSSGIHVLPQTFLFGTGFTYIASYYVKKGTQRYVSLEAGNTAIWPATVIFDLDEGVVDTETNGQGFIESVGNGWYRIASQATSTGSGNTNINLYMLDNSKNRSFVGAGTETLHAAHRMLCTGNQLTSYVPTDGSSQTRSPDELEIFSSNLPWPEPEYLGSELLLNGTFDTLDNLTPLSGASLSLVTRDGNSVLRVTATGTGQASARQSVTIYPGKVYHLSCYLHAEVNCVAIAVFGGNLRQTGVPYVSLVPGQNDLYIELDGSTESTMLALQVGGSPTNGSYLEIDNVSLKEIKPRAVSISMEGKVNYGDIDAYNTVEFYRWYKDSTNFLSMSLTTNSSFEGRYIGIHEAKDDYQQVTPSVDTVEPGVNRPYTVACRYTQNEMRMAEQGLVYTANTALTHLADLSNSNFELGRIYSGTIKNFRIWAEDIGDTGLVDATKPSTTTSLDWEFDTQQTSSIDRGVGY